MSSLNLNKLHVEYKGLIDKKSLTIPRRYTLTHSDSTGDLFLTISPEYDEEQISGLYTRLMRDEVLAEWIKNKNNQFELHIFLHVSGGFCFGWAGLRDRIFRHHLPLVLEAFKFGDAKIYTNMPELEESSIIVHFQSDKKRYCSDENFGTIKEIC